MDQAEALRKISREKGITPRAARGSVFQRVIAVASGKGGVGKTTITVNLAVLLGQWGQRVLLLDGDLGMANVDILLNLHPRYTVMDVLQGRSALEEVLLDGPFNLKIIPGGSGLYELADLKPQERELLLSRLFALEEMGDILFIDSAAGISRNVMSLAAAAEELLVVATPEPTSITDAYGLIKTAVMLNRQADIKLVVNMVESPGRGQEIGRRLKKVCTHFLNLELKYLGEISFDVVVKKSISKCVPFILHYPDSRPSEELRRIGRRLIYREDGEGPLLPAEKKGFFRKLFRLWN